MPDETVEVLSVDAIVTETFGTTATITKHPVEQGANPADHIRLEPETLRLDVVVSNTSPSETETLDPMAAEAAHAQLLAWQAAGALLDVPTTLGTRSSMAIQSVGAVRDAKTGGPPGQTGGLRISLALEQIRIVQNKLVRTTVSADKRVGGKVKSGKRSTKETQPALPAWAQDSTLLDVTNGATNFYQSLTGAAKSP